MKLKYLLGVLGAVCVLLSPIKTSANSLSYVQPESSTGIPVEVREYAEIVGHHFNICPELLIAIAERESSLRPDAVNGPCKGLMQINANIHEQAFIDAGWTSEEWNNPYKNMYVAGSYLHELFEKYEDCGIVLGVYHGERNAVENGMSGNLSSYTEGILIRSEELERAYGK